MHNGNIKNDDKFTLINGLQRQRRMWESNFFFFKVPLNALNGGKLKLYLIVYD